jgi:hypothetical protein
MMLTMSDNSNIITNIHILALCQKVRSITIMLWESERENSRLKREIVAKDEIINDLNIDIYFSDLELNDLKHQIELSIDVEYLHNLQDQIRDLSKSNQVLSDMIPNEFSF